ncbi:hypothetical protein SAMD00023353_2600230 [Rosellinia necatrix]|uniref:Uncharacterized protein n=1 Tax=Rosellinia necatrix TaxID=77044 RepID=A0A1S8A970_ROSNE|nr:hypothetical protein SAMD00023353_2600230 [Rosellinia necatrix]
MSDNIPLSFNVAHTFVALRSNGQSSNSAVKYVRSRLSDQADSDREDSRATGQTPSMQHRMMSDGRTDGRIRRFPPSPPPSQDASRSHQAGDSPCAGGLLFGSGRREIRDYAPNMEECYQDDVIFDEHLCRSV